MAALGQCSLAATGPSSEAPVGAEEIVVRWTPDPAGGLPLGVEVLGLTTIQLAELHAEARSQQRWQECFPVFVETGKVLSEVDLPPMAGRYQVEGNRLTFVPAFPIQAGIRYRATLRVASLPGTPAQGHTPVSAVFYQKALPPVPSTRVAAIFPATDALPENLLKFYLHFTGPMSRGGIYEHIRLRTAEGESVELPFLEIDEELWDPSLTRLTLFLDPGRIKRGVRPLEEVGPSLAVGGRYVLEIDRGWKDGQGAPLMESFAKEFKVVAADRDPPDPVHWVLRSPQGGTRDPLVVIFPEPMDEAITRRALSVIDREEVPVAGVAELQDLERRWVFVPKQPWKPGPKRLRFPSVLEDLAGNNIGKPFDVDLFERVDRRLSHEVIDLPFEVR